MDKEIDKDNECENDKGNINGKVNEKPNLEINEILQNLTLQKLCFLELQLELYQNKKNLV
jgi:hypothetical protein